MHHSRARTDDNQPQITAALRKAGCTVVSLHATGGGVPDLLVGAAGKNYLLEIKSATGKLNQVQITWHASWRGQCGLVRTPEQALRAVGKMRAAGLVG